ncbi:ParA family protein [Desulfohalobiaceae bacterium Ax17]|uniref:ParA family protein n=1 Tax=Desulfovulcanus ferrireducens TaxID=2831190 RepID=UPI00207BBE96|nr:ParA family protein [Desulfovulcanus ferrireducens]MBT8763069.1 ParA family protein [Desulfovulcanus ferrireducens]
MVQHTLIVAIANRKGGTGKTTTAVNLAAEWARQGKKCLLIDLDTQGHAGWGLGFKDIRKFDLYAHDMFHDPQFRLHTAVHKTVFENLYFVPANLDFQTSKANPDNLILKRQLADLLAHQTFARIILDTPPTLDLILVNALAAAHGVLIPFLPHYLAGIGVRQMARLFYQVATNYNKELRLIGLFPVMFDRRIKMHQQVIRELTAQFGQQRILRGIRTNVRLAEAFAAGQPVSHYAPKSPGAMDYHLLAEELETLWKR